MLTILHASIYRVIKRIFTDFSYWWCFYSQQTFYIGKSVRVYIPRLVGIPLSTRRQTISHTITKIVNESSFQKLALNSATVIYIFFIQVCHPASKFFWYIFSALELCNWRYVTHSHNNDHSYPVPKNPAGAPIPLKGNLWVSIEGRDSTG